MAYNGLIKCKEVIQMKTDSVSSVDRSTLQRYCNENDLPLYLNAKDISRLLGISQTNVYYLFRSDGFPIIIIGKRRLVKREVLLAWLESKSVSDWQQKSCFGSGKRIA